MNASVRKYFFTPPPPPKLISIYATGNVASGTNLNIILIGFKNTQGIH